MQRKATTVAEYIAELPPDRRDAVEALRAVIRKNIDPTFAEGMQYGMIGYYVPHTVFPAGYHCDPKQPLPFGSLASQKNHLSLSFMCLYTTDEDHHELLQWFRKAWAATGKKLDMGKACIRFKKIEDVPLEVIAELLRKVSAKDYIAYYEAAIDGRKRAKAAAGTPAAPRTKKPTAKPAAKKTAAPKTRKRTT